MRKALGLFILLLLSLSIVHAEGIPRNVTRQHEVDPQDVRLNGLQNAIVHVSNNATKEHLAAVLLMIQEKDRARLANLSSVAAFEDADGFLHVQGGAPAKLLGIIPVTKTYTYDVVGGTDGTIGGPNGTQLSYHHGFFDFLYKIPSEVQ